MTFVMVYLNYLFKCLLPQYILGPLLVDPVSYLVLYAQLQAHKFCSVKCQR